ncbi:hypothetical protein BDV06DRAFT_225714 [Aspergillus oleicola]
MRLIALAPIVALFTTLAFAITCWDDRRVQGNTKDLEKGKTYLKKIGKGGLQVFELTNDVEMSFEDYVYGRYKWVSANPSSCEELFCEEATGIYFCNDDPKNHRWMEMEHIIESIVVIKDEFLKKGDKFIAGEIDHPDLWRVKIKQPYSYEGSDKWGQCDETWPALAGLKLHEWETAGSGRLKPPPREEKGV